MDVHKLAGMLTTALNDEDSPAWNTHLTGLTKEALKAHRNDDHVCYVYVKLEGKTYSLTIQEVST